MGLSVPALVPYTPEIIDALNQGVIARRMTTTVTIFIFTISAAIVAAIVAGFPLAGLVIAANFGIAVLASLFARPLSSYFRRTHRGR